MESFNGTIEILTLDFKCPACGSKNISTSTAALNNFFCADCHYTWVQQKLEKIKLWKKEAATMQVTYNGFTGELEQLERVSRERADVPMGIKIGEPPFNLSIYDTEKGVTYSFTNVKLEDVKFLGGAVSFAQ